MQVVMAKKKHKKSMNADMEITGTHRKEEHRRFRGFQACTPIINL
jgi:hypothetical protein